MNSVLWAAVAILVIYLNVCAVVGIFRLGDKHRQTHWSDKILGPGIMLVFGAGILLLRAYFRLREMVVKRFAKRVVNEVDNVVIGVVDHVRPSGLMYPKHIVMMGFMQRRVPDLFGAFDEEASDDNGAVAMSKVSHRVSDIRIDERGNVLGKITIMETERGRAMKKLLAQRGKDALTYGIRAHVQTKRENNVEVVTKMDIICVDAVSSLA